MAGEITNADIYNAINDLRQEVNIKIDKVDEKVDKNTAWINQATGKMTVMFAVIGLVMNFTWDLISSKFKGV